VLLAGVLFPACTPRDPHQEIEKAVAQFHENIDLGDFDRVYADASSAYRQFRTRAQSADALGKVIQRHGRFVSSTMTDSIVRKKIDGVTFAATFDSQYSLGIVVEYFVFLMPRNSRTVELVQYRLD
jgi:hypothetical protein